MKIQNYSCAFDNLNTLNDMVLDSALSMLKTINNETEVLILKTIESEKPEHLYHLTNEEWDKYKKHGQRLLDLNSRVK